MLVMFLLAHTKSNLFALIRTSDKIRWNEMFFSAILITVSESADNLYEVITYNVFSEFVQVSHRIIKIIMETT